MTQKIAIAIIHGIGNQKEDFYEDVSELLNQEFNKLIGQTVDSYGSNQLEIEPVFWAPIVQEVEDELWKKFDGLQLWWKDLRRFIVSYVGDGIAYQIPPSKTPKDSDKIVYLDIHEQFRQSLKNLKARAGKKAPLCVIAHSLGSIIASNFFYDLQVAIPYGCPLEENSPLENGETLTLFYTLGCPIPLWSLRFTDFGIPIQIPNPKLASHYPDLEGEWINFYDKDDVLGYPLRNLNDKYRLTVKEDIEVKAGGCFIGATPLSHMYYWNNQKAISTIAQSLAKIWLQINGN
ncbi:chemotaxis protein [Ammoniphilus resinae]|uniref:Chemotaxis protein n=1 Tax=Ammoniphilus resinae TaxID=861532 RepID=A0ABS4GW27_9BACL|nr:chemotaxis protein [Ammoniphilus resinae]MBP1934473.1 hypothetical protein [Ammoniphilus resinae]